MKQPLNNTSQGLKSYQIFRGNNEHGGLMVSAEPFSEIMLDLQLAIRRADMFAQYFPRRDWMVSEISDRWRPQTVHHIAGEQIWLVLPSASTESPNHERRVPLRCVEGTDKIDYGCYVLLLQNDDLFHRTIFENLRDRAGAWIQCDRMRHDVASALDLAWTSDGLPGIGQPPSSTTISRRPRRSHPAKA